MKHFLISFLLLFSVVSYSQVNLTCYTYDNFSASDCYGCGLKTGLFAGVIVTTEGVKIALHKPIKVTYKGSTVYFEDAFGNKYNSQVSRINQDVRSFVADCLKDGGSASATDGLRVNSGNVFLGSDSPTDPKGSQLIQDNNLHLNGFNQNWINNPLEPTRPTLSLQDNGDVFFGATNTTAASFRSALFFDHSKSSFAVGYHDATQLGTIGNTAFIANDRTSATGTNSSAFGLTTLASGIGSFATGLNTTATNQYASSFGSSTVASGRRSISMGEITTASGNNSFAGGISSQSQGVNSFAFGNTSIASGLESISFGKSNTASGPQSAVLGGESNVSSGTYASSLGYGLVSKSYFETTIGSNNVDYTPTSAVAFSLTDRLFNVGNGSSLVDKSNAITTLKNGRTKIISRLNAAGSLTNAEVTPRTAFEVLTVTTNGGNSNGGAILAPQTQSQRNSITGVDLINGLIIYCTDCLHCNGNQGVYQSYQSTSSSWVNICDGSEVRQLSSGMLVDWQSKKLFGSEATPETGGVVTFNILSQRVEQQWMFHQAAGVPTFPSTSVVSGTYNNGAINFIRFEYVSPTRINILINQ